MPSIQDLFSATLDLFYPQLCITCEERKPQPEQLICLTCENTVFKISDLHNIEENQLSDRFWGRVDFQHCMAMFYYTKEHPIQKAIYALKYGNRPDVGVWLGEYYGKILMQEIDASTIDLIIPVPLHPKKKHQRGYNQAVKFAEGLSNVLDVPWSAAYLSRARYTQTQTKKSRLERLENVKDAFQLLHGEQLKGKHILLVDDVVTTGATLETCALQLLSIDDVKLSLASIAFASSI